MTASAPFRFDAVEHAYIDLTTGQILPHITGMLVASGAVDDTWFSEESSIRGTAVHTLTADFDLGALNPATCVSRHRGYLLGYEKAVSILKPEILAVEEPVVHPILKFAGRPDRKVRVLKRAGVMEIKTTAAPHRSHEIQTALQAILVADSLELEPEHLVRLAVYLRPSGRFKVLEHCNRHDFNEARRIIREYAR